MTIGDPRKSHLGGSGAFLKSLNVIDSAISLYSQKVLQYWSQHPFISKSEKNRIKETLGRDLNPTRDQRVPWKSIFTSLPFIGLMITDSGNTWGLWTLSTNGPTYMKYILGLDIKTSGVLSGLPLLCRELNFITIFAVNLTSYLIFQSL